MPRLKSQTRAAVGSVRAQMLRPLAVPAASNLLLMSILRDELLPAPYRSYASEYHSAEHPERQSSAG